MVKCLLLAACLFGPAYAEKLPTPKLDTRPVLTVVTENFPPFQSERNGRIVGPMHDFMLAACSYAEVRCEITMMPWKEALAMGEDGRADVLYSILLGVKEREDMFFTTPPIVRTAYSFFVASDSKWKWTGNPADLDSMTIGTYGPSGTSIVAAEAVAQSETGRMVVERTNLTVFNNLIAGVYGANSAVVVNKDVGLYLLYANNINGPKMAGDLKRAFFGFGYSKKSKKPELRERFMAGVEVILRRGYIDNAFKLSFEEQR